MHKFFFIFKILYFSLRKHRVKNIFKISNFFYKKVILELGGPSRFFYKNIPIYQLASRVDCVNFDYQTLRDGKIIPGCNKYNYYKNKKGNQFVQDATVLDQIDDDSYDLIISSNCLEHIANPIKALLEWKRVLKKNAYLIIVLPNPKKTGDKSRNVTKFNHILGDFNKNITEKDKTHINEVIKKSAFTIDKICPDKETFIKLVNENYKYRILHHHVFDLNLIEEIASYLKISLIGYGNIKKDDYYIFKN